MAISDSQQSKEQEEFFCRRMWEIGSTGMAYLAAASAFRILMRSWRVRWVLGLAGVFLPFASAAGAWCQEASPGAALTLEQGIRLACENNRRIKNGELELGRSQDRLAIERTHLLPTLQIRGLGGQLLSPLDFKFNRASIGGTSTSGPITVFDERVHNGLDPFLFVNARISQPLSQLPRTQMKIQQFAWAEASAREKLRQQRQELVSELKRAYYEALETESALAVAEETVTLYKELDRVTQVQLVQRMLLPPESLSVKRRLATAQHELLCLRDTLTSQKEKINLLMGRDIDTQFALVPVPPAQYLESDLQAARARAVAKRAEVRLVQNERRQAEYARGITKQLFVPDLSLTVDYLSVFGLQLLPRNVVSVGLFLSWEPWDMGRKLRELSEQNKAVKESQNAQRELESQIAIDVSAGFRKLKQSRRLLQLSQLAQEEAREQLRVVMDKYRVQAALLEDVLRSQTALAEANHDYQRSLLAFWSAKADFERVVGDD